MEPLLFNLKIIVGGSQKYPQTSKAIGDNLGSRIMVL
jgi:hypothetical protein